MSDKKSIVRDAMRLTVITLVSGLLLGLIYQITLNPREAAAAKATNDAYKAVFEKADSFTPYKDFDSDKATALVKRPAMIISRSQPASKPMTRVDSH